MNRDHGLPATQTFAVDPGVLMVAEEGLDTGPKAMVVNRFGLIRRRFAVPGDLDLIETGLGQRCLSIASVVFAGEQRNDRAVLNGPIGLVDIGNRGVCKVVHGSSNSMLQR